MRTNDSGSKVARFVRSRDRAGNGHVLRLPAGSNRHFDFTEQHNRWQRPCRIRRGLSRRADGSGIQKELRMTTVETATGATKTMVLNMGPQHPSTHGVLRVLLELDGETVVRAVPDLGYLHTGIEKSCEDKTYSQAITLTDRMDYLNPLGNNLVYCLAVEKLLGLEVPKRAQYVRVMLVELQRISSHLVWLGTHAIDMGAMSVFLYCFREREEILKIFELFAGQRMMTSYIRIGGIALEPPAGWRGAVERFLRMMPSRIDDYESLLTGNRIWMGRLQGVGYISPEDAVALSMTGPTLRAAGVAYDNRKVFPYSSYDEFEFDVPTRTESDCFARYMVRVLEMRESSRLCVRRWPKLRIADPFEPKRRASCHQRAKR